MKRRISHFILIGSALIFTYLWFFPLTSESKEQEIPEQAIRLRILPNSDQAKDQWVKRKVRDVIVGEIKTWEEQPKNIHEARQTIRERLPYLKQLAEKTVRNAGFAYPVHIKLGQVPFPTKLYGEKVYPAGQYEALLVTLGKGQGANWWCVLFPPLCFVDMDSDREAIPKENQAVLSASAAQNESYSSTGSKENDSSFQVRFLFVEQISSLWKKVF